MRYLVCCCRLGRRRGGIKTLYVAGLVVAAEAAKSTMPTDTVDVLWRKRVALMHVAFSICVFVCTACCF